VNLQPHVSSLAKYRIIFWFSVLIFEWYHLQWNNFVEFVFSLKLSTCFLSAFWFVLFYTRLYLNHLKFIFRFSKFKIVCRCCSVKAFCLHHRISCWCLNKWRFAKIHPSCLFPFHCYWYENLQHFYYQNLIVLLNIVKTNNTTFYWQYSKSLSPVHILNWTANHLTVCYNNIKHISIISWQHLTETKLFMLVWFCLP